MSLEHVLRELTDADREALRWVKGQPLAGVAYPVHLPSHLFGLEPQEERLDETSASRVR